MAAELSNRVQLASSGPDYSRLDPLMQAIQAGDAAAVERVLSGDVDVNESTQHGTTPLMSAAEFGVLDIVRLLLKRGAAVNIKRSDGFTALALAVFFGHEDVVRELLVSGADLKATSISGTSPEMWAMARGFRDLADLLKSAGERGANVSPRMTLVSEPTPYLEVIQPRVVTRDDQDPSETTLVRPQASAMASNSEYFQSPVIEEQNQIIMELNETAAEIKAARAVDEIVVPFSPFVTLLDRLSTSWPRMAAVLILVTILSALATFAALKSVQRTPQGSQSRETVTESSLVKPVENPALVVQPVPSPAEQTTTSISNVPDQKPPEEVSSQQSDHALSSSANVIPSSEPANSPANSEVKPRVTRTSSSYINEERKGSRPKRRQGEAIVSTDNSNPSAEAKTPVTVTPVPNPPTTQPQSSKVTTDAPPLPVEAIKGSSTKRKVIQWP